MSAKLRIRPLTAGHQSNSKWLESSRPIIADASRGRRTDPNDNAVAQRTYFKSPAQLSSGAVRRAWVLCHEYRRSTRRCVTVREMKAALRVRQSGVDLKPPQAAVVKSDGGERCGKSRNRIPAGTILREASASEPLMTCRKRIRRCQNRGDAVTTAPRTGSSTGSRPTAWAGAASPLSAPVRAARSISGRGRACNAAQAGNAA